MVQGIENLAALTGSILARRTHPELNEFDLVSLELSANHAIAGLPHLVQGNVGDVIELAIRRTLLGSSGAGSKLSCRAKFTPVGIMAESHPADENFVIR